MLAIVQSCAAGLVLGAAATGFSCTSRAQNVGGTSPALSAETAGQRLHAAYPEHISGIDGGALIWRDGARFPISDGKSDKPVAEWLAAPDLRDIFRFRYPAGTPAAVPPVDADPGRARPAALFNKMYGDCRKGEVARHLVEVAWLPSRGPQTVKATTINSVAQKLAAISAELDALPAEFTKFLVPSAGTYNCRTIAGTEQSSAHSYGIAIDISVKHAHYWRWSKPGASANALGAMLSPT